jgi:hypothetical protein
MAKRKRNGQFARRKKSKAITRRSPTTATRYRTRAPAKRHRRRRSGGFGGGGGGGGLIPNKQELTQYAMAAGIGFLEGKAKDDAFFLNKIPKPIVQLGWLGNLALIARVANKMLIHKPILGQLAHTAGMITAYQIGRQGKVFTQATKPESIAGDDWQTGALDVDIEGDDDDDIEGDDDVEGIQYDEAGAPDGGY